MGTYRRRGALAPRDERKLALGLHPLCDEGPQGQVPHFPVGRAPGPGPLQRRKRREETVEAPKSSHLHAAGTVEAPAR